MNEKLYIKNKNFNKIGKELSLAVIKSLNQYIKKYE